MTTKIFHKHWFFPCLSEQCMSSTCMFFSFTFLFRLITFFSLKPALNHAIFNCFLPWALTFAQKMNSYIHFWYASFLSSVHVCMFSAWPFLGEPSPNFFLIRSCFWTNSHDLLLADPFQLILSYLHFYILLNCCLNKSHTILFKFIQFIRCLYSSVYQPISYAICPV